GVDAGRVLGDVPAEGGDQAFRAGVGAEDGDHGGDGVGAVVVAGAAREAQAAGDGEGAVGLVETEAQLGGADLHGRGEARVEVDVGNVVHADARQLEHGAGDGADRRRRVQVGPLGNEPVVVGVGPRPREHPTGL